MSKSRVLLLLVITTAYLNAQTSDQLGISGLDGGADNQTEAARSKSPAKAKTKEVVVFIGDTVVPHIVDGAGWKTAFTLTNLDIKPLHYMLLFNNDNGTDLILPISGIGRVRGIEGTLQIGGSTTFETDGFASQLSSGWALLVKDNANDSIGGFAVFRATVAGRPDFEAVVPIVNQFSNRFVLNFDNLSGFVTAMAMANPDLTQSISIPVNIRDERGNTIAQDTISVGRFGHSAFTLASRFPVTVGRRGSIEFRTTGFGVGVLGLRFNPGGSFTSFNVLTNISWVLNP